jgi:single-strand DNA-binding protein
MINRIILVGRLTKDPELRKTNNDTAVASFTLAVDNRTKDQDGNRTTTFVTVVVWNQQAENVSKFLRKGALVGVDGRLVQRNFERRDGSKGSVLEVVADSVQFLEPKGERTNEQVNEIKDESRNLDIIEDTVDDDLPF